MAKIGPDNGWEKELKKIIGSKEAELSKIILGNRKRKETELDVVASIEKVIEERVRNIITLIKPREEIGIATPPRFEKRPYRQPEPTGTGDDLSLPSRLKDRYPHLYEYEMIMPELADVVAANLLFRIEVRGEKKRGEEIPKMSVFLRAYHKYSDTRLDQKGNLELPYEPADEKKVDDFVKDSITGFIESWYTRKIGEEMDREREYEVKIVVK